MLPVERQQEVLIRAVASKLARLLELDNRSLVETRPLARRLVGNCRDFTLLLASIPRCHHRVPARARCGFGAYFLPNHYEDHRVCEVREGGRWRLVDAHLDGFRIRAPSWCKPSIRYNTGYGLRNKGLIVSMGSEMGVQDAN